MEEEYIKSIKGLYRNKSNNVIVFLSVLTVLLLFSIILNAVFFIKLNKKIDHRYFNTIKTLEEVYNINVNTYDGSIRHYR